MSRAVPPVLPWLLALNALLATVGSTGCAADPAGLGRAPGQEPSAPPEPSPWSVQVQLGARDMNGESWRSLDTQSVFGIAGVYAPDDWPFGVEAGVSLMHDTGTIGGVDRTTETVELALGLRKEFPLGSGFDFVFGAGGFVAHTGDYDGDADWFEGDHVDSDDWGGVYVRGGLLLRVSDSMRVGLDVRIADGNDLEIAGDERSGNYEQLAATLIWNL